MSRTLSTFGERLRSCPPSTILTSLLSTKVSPPLPSPAASLSGASPVGLGTGAGSAAAQLALVALLSVHSEQKPFAGDSAAQAEQMLPGCGFPTCVQSSSEGKYCSRNSCFPSPLAWRGKLAPKVSWPLEAGSLGAAVAERLCCGGSWQLGFPVMPHVAPVVRDAHPSHGKCMLREPERWESLRLCSQPEAGAHLGTRILRLPSPGA